MVVSDLKIVPRMERAPIGADAESQYAAKPD
jgi:hypothetical protein